MPAKVNTSNWNGIVERMHEFKIQKGLTSFLNPYSMLKITEKKDIDGIDNWYADGISLVKLIRIFYKKDITRYSFDDTSIAPIFFNYVKENNLSMAVIGTQKGIINDAVNNIERKYGLQAQFFRNGYFENEEQLQQTITTLMEQKIDAVVCGMGAPLQEEFLIKMKERGWDGYGFTCGGYLHQFARKIEYYPEFFDKHDLRWLYRIYDEPKLLSRYLIRYPLFFMLFLKMRFTKKS